MRKIDLTNAEASIDYYKQQISESISEDLINVTTRLLEGELRKKMLANVRQDYALMPLDPAYFPDDKFSPSRLLILIFSIFLSALIGIFIIYYQTLKKKFSEILRKPNE